MSANIAGETIFILNYYDGIDEAKANAVIDKVFDLLTEKINDVSVAYDKTCKEFTKATARLTARRRPPTTRNATANSMRTSTQASTRFSRT